MTLRLRHLGDGHWQAAGPADLQRSREYPVGSSASFDEQKARSSAQERRWFGILKTTWDNMDDHLRRRFPDPEALRKWALIRAGWCESREFVAEGEEAAALTAAGLRWAEPYSIVVQAGNVVFAYRAKSQGRKAMGRQQFAEFTERGLAHISELLGCDVDDIPWQEAA